MSEWPECSGIPVGVSKSMSSVILRALVLLITAQGLLAGPTSSVGCGGTCSPEHVSLCCATESADRCCCDASGESCCNSRLASASDEAATPVPCQDCHCSAAADKLPVLPAGQNDSRTDHSNPFVAIGTFWLPPASLGAPANMVRFDQATPLAPRVPARVLHCLWLI